MYFTQEQLDTIQLPIRGKRIKLEVLNDDKQTLATLEGNAIGGGLQKDATAFIRRSGSIQLAIPRLADATTFLDLVDGVTINVNGKIWLDKQIRISVGIDNYIQPYGQESKIVWYDFGICLIDQPVRAFSADAYTMSFNVIDLSAKLNGDRGGQLTALTTMIERVEHYGTGFGELISLGSISNAINAICEDAENVYLGSADGTFLIYNKERSSVDFTIVSPLSPNPIYCMVADSENVYVAGGDGLTPQFVVYNKMTGVFGSLVTTPFSSNPIYSMTQDQDNVYVGNVNGKIAIYNKANEQFGSSIGTLSQVGIVYTIAQSGDKVYYSGYEIGTYKPTISIYNKLTQTVGDLIYLPSTNYNIAHAVAQDENYLYYGGGQGMFVAFDKRTNTFNSVVSSSPFSAQINCMWANEFYVYCGGANGEFALYQISTGEFGGLATTSLGTSDIYAMSQYGLELYVAGASGKFALYDSTIYTKTENALSFVIKELATIGNYSIYPVPKKWEILPYDIKVTIGQTVYDVLKQFLDILNGWQMYFDNNAVFIVEPIPSGANDFIYPLNAKLNIVDTNAVDFNYVRNQVVVYGRSHQIQFFAEGVGYNQFDDLTLDFETLDWTKIQVGSTLFGFKNNRYLNQGVYVGGSIESVTLRMWDSDTSSWTTIVSHSPITIYGINSEFPFDDMPLRDDEIYIIRIKDATTIRDEADREVIDFTQSVFFEFLGKQQIAYSAVNGNPESPFYINRGYGAKRSAYGDNVDYSLHESSVAPYVEIDYYDITLTDTLGGVQTGDIITFISPRTNQTTNVKCSIVNKDGTDYATNKNIVTSSSVATLVVNKLGNDYTVWEMQYDGTNFVLNGHCPYALPLVESGGEFDNIYADELAKERATYDLFLHSNLQNTITLSCVPDYSLDVNYRIPYNSKSAIPPDAQLQDNFEERYFITKQVTYPLGLDNTPQNITAIEIYDDYNYVGYAYDLPTTT